MRRLIRILALVLAIGFMPVAPCNAQMMPWPPTSVSNLTANVNAAAEHDITGFSVNGEVNVQDPKYGASASMTSGTATLNGTTAATLDAVHDFAVGQHVVIYGAGPASALTAPTLTVASEAYGAQATGLLSTTNKYGYSNAGNSGCWIDKLSSLSQWSSSGSSGGNYNPGDEIAMNLNGVWYGLFAWNITGPTAPGSTVPDFKSLILGPPSYLGGPWNSSYVGDGTTIHWSVFGVLGNSNLANTSCSTTYSYEVCPVDANGGIGTCSSVQTLSNGAAILSPGNANLLTITNPANTVADIIGRCTGASCTPGFYSIVPTYGSSTSQIYHDIGNAQGQYLDAAGGVHIATSNATTPMPTVVNQPLLTTIVSCGTSTPGGACTSTAFVLANAATGSGAFTMLHDDGPAFNAALAAASAAGQSVSVPPGQYPIATTVNLNNSAGMRLSGQLGEAGQNAVLNWTGGIGGTMLQMWKTRDALVERLKLRSATGATPGVGVDIDNTGTGTTAPTHDTLRDVQISFVSNGIRLANLSTANCDSMTFEQVTFGEGSDGGHAAIWIGGAGQTNNERFNDIAISYGPWDYLVDLGGVRGTQVGSVVLDGFSTSASDTIGVRIANTVKRLKMDSWYVEGLARLFYDEGGAGNSTYINNSYFNGSNITPDGFYVVANRGEIASANTIWGIPSANTLLKINVGQPYQYTNTSGRLISLGDTFSDPFAIFTPSTSTNNYSILIQGATGLSDTGNAANTESTFAAKIFGPLIAPTIWGGHNSIGRITTAKVGTIAAPTVTVVGTAGSTSHTYYLVCHDANGGSSAVSAGTTVTNANATLNATNYDSITWPFYPGCVSFDVYRDATSGASLLASNVSQTVRSGGGSGASAYQVLDQGQKLSSSTAPALDTTGDAIISGAIDPNFSQTSLSGTTGTALCSEAVQGTSLKIATCYLNGYAQTGTAQTYTFPIAFSAAPVLLESGGSCGTYNPSSTATVLTLPANASMTAETCNVVAEGQ
jgi:hypothetical protein